MHVVFFIIKGPLVLGRGRKLEFLDHLWLSHAVLPDNILFNSPALEFLTSRFRSERATTTLPSCYNPTCFF